MFKDALREQVEIERGRREENERKYSMTDKIEETGTAYSVSIEVRGKLSTAIVIVTPVRDDEGNVTDFNTEMVDFSREFVPADFHIDQLYRQAIDQWKDSHEW